MYLPIKIPMSLNIFIYIYLKTKFIIKDDDSSILSHLYKLTAVIFYRSSDYIFILFNRIDSNT